MRLAGVMEVSRSGYYDWLRRPMSQRRRDDTRLIQEIKRISIESAQTYGRPRILQELLNHGYHISPRRVQRLMKEADIKVVSNKKVRMRTTDSRHHLPVSANLLKRNFHAQKANQIWASDITYIRTHQGWAYLCIILDLYSRRIVGWSIRDHLRATLVTESLAMAFRKRRVVALSLIFHSDRGSQYASDTVRAVLRENSIISSMSSTGDCFDNAVAESAFGTIKTERVYSQCYESVTEARRDMFRYIEGFYNRRRMHSYLGYLSPEEFEMKNEAA